MGEPVSRPLHVALLSYRGNMFCGGQGVYITSLARALSERGHRVRVLAGPPYPAPVQGVETVQLPDQNYINHPSTRLPAPGPLSVFRPLELAEYGLARAGSNPEMLAFSMRCFEVLRRIHQHDPLDVVCDNQGLGYGLLLVKALGVPVATTVHHPLQVDRAEDIKQTAGMLKKIRRAVYYPLIMQKTVAKRLDRLITVSDFSKELISRFYDLERDGMEVVPNGIDTGLYRPLSDVKREPGRLLFVGSTEDRKKGVRYLLEALSGLPERFKLIIVDGRRYPGRVYAENLVKKLGLSGRVEFKDRISVPELINEYNRAAIMVVPSLFEGFGLPALEAMACGTPVIATTAGALPEVVDEECAVLVKPGSSRSIKEAVLSLESDPARLESMGKKGRDRAGSRFCWDKTAEKMERIFAELSGAGKIHAFAKPVEDKQTEQAKTGEGS
ncbi:MAG: glycosyltransferase family 4 protein [bacterium]